jgi:hypothetical protein
VAFTAPVPRPPHRLSAVMQRPLSDVLTPFWVLPDPAPFSRRSPSHQTSFRSTRWLTISRQTPRRLGPRSLVPPPFLERCVRAYSRPGCCSSTSATANDVRALSPGLSFPRRDDGHDHLPFLTHHARPLGNYAESGDTRRAAHSSVQSWPRCRFLLLAQVFPTAIPRLPRHLPTVSHRRVECRLTCTGLWTE